MDDATDTTSWTARERFEFEFCNLQDRLMALEDPAERAYFAAALAAMAAELLAPEHGVTLLDVLDC